MRVTAGDRVVIPVAVDAQPVAEVFWLTPSGPADMISGFKVRHFISILAKNRDRHILV